MEEGDSDDKDNDDDDDGNDDDVGCGSCDGGSSFRASLSGLLKWDRKPLLRLFESPGEDNGLVDDDDDDDIEAVKECEICDENFEAFIGDEDAEGGNDKDDADESVVDM